MLVMSNWNNLVLKSTFCLICQLGSAIPQRSAIINTNAIMDNATVDHPPPYDQLKNTSSFQLKNVKTSKAITTRIAAAQKNPPTVKDGKGCPFRIAATMAMIKAIKWQMRARNIKAITAPFQSDFSTSLSVCLSLEQSDSALMSSSVTLSLDSQQCLNKPR